MAADVTCVFAFDQQTDVFLKDDFSFMGLNKSWHLFCRSVISLAKTLNVGPASLLFCDLTIEKI